MTCDHIVLRDIELTRAYEKNKQCPDPWKARYALDFKDAAYLDEIDANGRDP